MSYEIDFLPVGEGSRSGDAILLRWGDLGNRSSQTVVLIDGGYNSTAGDIVDHLYEHYGTGRVDIAISTHPDADHVNGLRDVLRKVEVGELWMHLPSEHSTTMAHLRAAGWRNMPELRESIRLSMAAAVELQEVAQELNVSIIEPLAGRQFEAHGGELYVAGPSLEFYEALLPQFTTYEGRGPLATVLDRLYEAARRFIPETWWEETLTDQGTTSPENNSSTVLQLRIDGRTLLFTGDAGIPALESAFNHLESVGRSDEPWTMVQVPHHGSRRNVGPTILDRILGSVAEEGTERGVAFVSCAPEGEPKHPHRKVVNAFRRRGYPVRSTAGKGWLYFHDAPPREGWSPGAALPFYSDVDDD